MSEKVILFWGQWPVNRNRMLNIEYRTQLEVKLVVMMCSLRWRKRRTLYANWQMNKKKVLAMGQF